MLAAEIIKALDREGLSVRGLVSIINRLGSRVEVRIRVRRAETTAQGVPA
jgi:hypothetical protein